MNKATETDIETDLDHATDRETVKIQRHGHRDRHRHIKRQRD